MKQKITNIKNTLAKITAKDLDTMTPTGITLFQRFYYFTLALQRGEYTK